MKKFDWEAEVRKLGAFGEAVDEPCRGDVDKKLRRKDLRLWVETLRDPVFVQSV